MGTEFLGRCDFLWLLAISCPSTFQQSCIQLGVRGPLSGLVAAPVISESLQGKVTVGHSQCRAQLPSHVDRDAPPRIFLELEMIFIEETQDFLYVGKVAIFVNPFKVLFKD